MVEVTPFINGEAIASCDDATLDLFNPATGEKSLTMPAGCEEDVNRAVASSRTAYDDGRWSRLPPSQRRNILHQFANLIDQSALELDTFDALDMGKPLSVPLGNAASAANLIRYCADAIDKIFGDVFQSDRSVTITQHRLPRGVVGAIVPWNFPTMNSVMKLAPALAAGNCVVLKPSECSPQSAQRLAQLAIDAGLPPGVFNLVPGKGDTVGRALALHLDVDMITFTGSTLVGKLMMQYAGQSNMKVVHAECGGKTPQIVFADFENLDTVADHVARMILINQGQLCVAGSRLLVQKEIEAPLIEKVAERFKKIVVGDPLDKATTFGPLVNQQQMNKVLGYVDAGQAADAELITGGHRLREGSGGCFVAPTLFANVPMDASIAQEEIFGPVLSCTAFSDVDEAIRLANSTVYGLTSHVWTSSLPTGIKLSQSIRAGTVRVNFVEPTGEGSGAISTEPYGLSGVGVDNGLAGIESYLRRQVVWLNHG